MKHQLVYYFRFHLLQQAISTLNNLKYHNLKPIPINNLKDEFNQPVHAIIIPTPNVTKLRSLQNQYPLIFGNNPDKSLNPITNIPNHIPPKGFYLYHYKNYPTQLACVTKYSVFFQLNDTGIPLQFIPLNAKFSPFP